MSRITTLLFVLSGLISTIGCSPRTEVAPAAPEAGAPSAENPRIASVSSCGLDQPGSIDLTESEIALGLEVSTLYVERVGECPSQEQLNELRYIWTENEEFWSEFPARIDLFFRSNIGDGSDPELRAMAGRSFEEVKTEIVSDPEFPMTQDRGPTVVKDMTFYEFSGGQAVYLVVVRNDTVSRAYFFDQI